jgi:hypothetical protein
MKITESQLRNIIKQELKNLMFESETETETETDHAAELKKRIADNAANKKKRETEPSSASSKPSSSSPSYEDRFNAAKGNSSKDAEQLKARIAANKK